MGNIIPLWSSGEVATATRARLKGDWEAGGVSIDSRTVQRGDIFIAIAGEVHDGHLFVPQALEKGAAAAIVSHPANDADLSRLVIVSDTYEALKDLACFSRRRSNARVIAVTGSLGKTGTKEMLASVLAAHGPTHATSGNFNNHYGLPLSLARMPRSSKYGVFEIGMNHSGEIMPLSQLLQPHVAIITAIAPVHLENFSSLAAIADAKAEIFSGLEADGVAILPAGSEFLGRLRAAAAQAGAGKIMSFGEEDGADARLLEYHPEAMGAEVIAEISGMKIAYRLSTPGKHWALNSLAVLLAATEAGIDLASAAQALARFRAPAGRGAVVELHLPGGAAHMLDDSYNASPDSMRGAFERLSLWRRDGGRLLLALGDMLELGADSAKLHAGLADDIIDYGFDGVFAAGKLMKNLAAELPPKMLMGHFANAEACAAAVENELRPGDVVLVKGSHGSKMHVLAASLRQKLGQAVDAI